MSWLSNIFHPSTKVPDTSAQDAEAKRQYDLILQQLRDQQAAEQARYEQQRADDERRYQEQYTYQQTQAQQQRAAADAEIQRQVEQQRQVQAQQQAERDAVEAQANQRAAAARDFATKRQGLIDDSTKQIDAAYAGFDDNYFQQFAQKFVDYYKPQLEREATDQNHKVTYAYADTGGLRSSATAKAFGDLQRGKNEKEGEIAQTAQDKALGFKNDVYGQKNDALSSIYAAGAAASPLLPDGTIDSTVGLGSLTSQIGATTAAATRRAQSVAAPSFTASPLSVSLAGVAKRPTQYGTAS